MSTADAQPTLPFEPHEPEPRRRRRAWPWIVVLILVLALLAGAAVGAESIARGTVEGGIRTLVATQVQVPPGESVDVEVEGLVLPQLIGGTFEQITVSAPDVTVGPLTGDVTVVANGVPIRGDAPAAGGTATVSLDATQLRALLASVDGFPSEAVGIAAPNVTASTELSLFGASIPLGLALAPGAADGALTLTPAALTVGGAEVTADAARAQFGALADAVVRDWSICIAGDVPQALTLTGAEVSAANELVATFDVDGRVVVDRSLLSSGSCP